MSGRSVQPCPNPRRQLIVTNVEQPAIRLDPRRRAPEGDERARQRGVEEIDRDGIVQHAAHAERRYCPAIGATIPVEPLRDFRIALTKPAWRHADPYSHREAPLGRRDDLARVAGHGHGSHFVLVEGSHAWWIVSSLLGHLPA